MKRYFLACRTSWLLLAIGAGISQIALGADHIEVRNAIIQFQLAQLENRGVLIVGDSIVESWLGKSIGNCQVLNAGLGGGGLDHVVALLGKMRNSPDRGKIDGVVIAIGVNDTRRRVVPPDFMSAWHKSYAEMIDLALKVNPRVAVSTILPVENDMPLGAIYFDRSLIDRLNTSIRQLSLEKGVTPIDSAEAFRRANWSGHYTVDGVHLTRDAYLVFGKGVHSSMAPICPEQPVAATQCRAANSN